MSYAETMRQHRIAAGLTLKELADVSKVNWSYLWRVESGKSNPTLQTLVALADAYGLTLDEYTGHKAVTENIKIKIHRREDMTYGECMRAARQKAKLSIAKLDEISGIHRTLIGDYENDERLPNIQNAEALADALHISIDEYIGHEVKTK